MEDVNITKVESFESEVHIWVELPKKEHICPYCGTQTDRVHDYGEQIVEDVSLGRTAYLHLRNRRYPCIACDKRFAEKSTLVPRYCRSASGHIASVIQSFLSVLSAAEIADRYNVSVPTALRYFDCVSCTSTKLHKVLSIDEFKGNAWQIQVSVYFDRSKAQSYSRHSP